MRSYDFGFSYNRTDSKNLSLIDFKNVVFRSSFSPFIQYYFT
jgi:hypothetical protein